MINQFSTEHEGLEPGRYFDTVWVALPNQSHQYIKEALTPIKDFCEWISVLGIESDSKAIPHITLRYLGYDTNELRERINKNIPDFKKVIKPQIPVKIILGEIFSWEGKDKLGNKYYRLNWKIKNPDKLLKIHLELLKINGFEFFNSLEGNNFNAHISLGQIKKGHQDRIKTYLESFENRPQNYQLSDFAINFVSLEKSKSFRISLV